MGDSVCHQKQTTWDRVTTAVLMLSKPAFLKLLSLCFAAQGTVTHLPFQDQAPTGLRSPLQATRSHLHEPRWFWRPADLWRFSVTSNYIWRTPSLSQLVVTIEGRAESMTHQTSKFQPTCWVLPHLGFLVLAMAQAWASKEKGNNSNSSMVRLH